LTTHKTPKRKTFMPLVGFELEIPESERPQAHDSDLGATGIGTVLLIVGQSKNNNIHNTLITQLR